MKISKICDDKSFCICKVRSILYVCVSIFYCDAFLSNTVGQPPAPVGEITVIKGSLNFTASWDPVTNDLVCGGPLSYDVRISPSSGVMMMRITDTSYNFTGLTSDSIYTVTVAGRNNIGVGESASVMVSFAGDFIVY